MQVTDTVETKQLIKLNEKFLDIAKTAHSFRNNLKALKICVKLIDIETEEIKKSKLPIDQEKINIILWRYADLRGTLRYLIKTRNIQEINKGCADIESMISNTQRQIVELGGQVAVGGAASTSQKIVNAIGETAQKIGDAVSEKIDGLKKIFSVDESSKSE